MKYEDLSLEQKEYIREIYSRFEDNRGKAQEILGDFFNVTPRSIRNWVKNLGLTENEYRSDKILIYDLETSRVLADVWWPHNQYISPDSLHEQPRIITVAWKWLHEDQVYTLRWEDKKTTPISGYDIAGWGDDTDLVKKFAKVYNEADLAIGVNSDKFDKRFLAQRCLVHKVPFNRFVPSLDIQKASKKEFRTPSYSLKYQANVMGISQKRGHEGIDMWRKAQYHTDPKVRSEAVDAMEHYNIGDIITTEEMYLDLIPYIDHKIHFGTMGGNHKWSCPNCGSTEDVVLSSTTSTKMGTIQHVMKCESDGQLYKVSHTAYLDYIRFKMKQVQLYDGNR